LTKLHLFPKFHAPASIILILLVKSKDVELMFRMEKYMKRQRTASVYAFWIEISDFLLQTNESHSKKKKIFGRLT